MNLFKIAVSLFGLIGFALAALSSYSFYESARPVYGSPMSTADKIVMTVMIFSCLAVAVNSGMVFASTISK